MTNNLSHATLTHAETFEAQQKLSLILRHSSVEDRKATLQRLLEVFEAQTPNMIEACRLDYQKPEAEVILTEIFPVVHEIKHALKHLKKWMAPKKVTPTIVAIGTQSRITYQPKGCCLIISPWNYPFNLTFGPVVSALAAGNTAIIKPSEYTPNCARVISQIVQECFRPEEVAVFEGDASVSQALLALPFDHIFFTGSPQVGKLVMASAAKHLASVTLELGGKSPVIIDQSADLKKSAAKVAWAKFTNNGQTCIAPDYVLVHESVREAFVDALSQVVKKSYGTSTEQIARNPDYCRVVNVAHTNRIKALIEDAQKGVCELALGVEKAETNPQDPCFIPPTIIVAKTDTEEFLQRKIMQEEIFGPVLPIIGYQTIDEAIDIINRLPKALALYLYSQDSQNIEQVQSRTSSGGFCINHNVLHFLHNNLPFGGVNNSGIGNSHGEYGFRAFSHERGVMEDKFTLTHLLFPPYTGWVKQLIRWVLKFAA